MGKLKYNITALLCGVIAGVITLAALRNFWLEKQITVSFSHTNSNRFQLKFTPLDKRGYKLLNGGVEFELPETQGKALKKTVTIPSDDLHAIHVDFKGSSGTLDIDNFSVSSGKKTISSGVVIFGENGVKTKINSADWNLKISDPAKAELSLKIPGKAKPRTVVCWFALANILLLSAAAGYLAAKQFSRKVSDKFTIEAILMNIGGNINPLGLNEVDAGGSCNYVITATEGYAVKQILVDDVAIENVEGAKNYIHIFENVGANHTIKVEFVADAVDSGDDSESDGGNGTLIVVLVIVVVAVLGAAALFIVKWRQEKY